MSPCLVVAAKQPERGKVKTRIGSALGDAQAAEVYGCALLDTLSLVLSISDVTHALSYAPATDDARCYFADIAPTFLLMPQRGATLGERLNHTLTRLLTRLSPIVVIGSDSPDLPAAFITRAFNLLRDGTDVVLGPASDGGYYLIGMKSMQPTLFERIDWSTEAVAQQTRERAEEAELNLVELPQWHDLDTVADLQLLVDPGAPLTRAFVARLNAKGK